MGHASTAKRQRRATAETGHKAGNGPVGKPEPKPAPEAKPKPSSRRKTSQEGFRPFKVLVQVVGAHRDAKGEILAEEAVAELILYRPRFGDLQQEIEERVWPKVLAERGLPPAED